MQIYRPGMGKFSSKTIKKESTNSPKTSPEESREASPSRKSADSKDKRDKREKKGREENKFRDNRDFKRPNTRQYVSKTFKTKRSEESSKEKKPDENVVLNTDNTEVNDLPPVDEQMKSTDNFLEKDNRKVTSPIPTGKATSEQCDNLESAIGDLSIKDAHSNW